MLSQWRPIFISILAENQRHGVGMLRYPHEGGDSRLEDGPVEGVPALLPRGETPTNAEGHRRQGHPNPEDLQRLSSKKKVRELKGPFL